jgi:hypothetical protein
LAVADHRGLIADTDAVLYFAPTQEARLAIMRRANELAATLVQQAMADADPDRRIRVVVGVDHEDKTVKQRAFLHVAVLPQIAEQAKVGGIRYVVRVWKEHFRATYLGDRWETFDLPGQFDAKGRQKRARRKVRISTEDLSIRQYSEYIDKVIAYGADELGVVFRFIAEEREAVRWKPKPRKARAEQREAVPA